MVLSVAPDGLIAWCWSRDDKPEIALGFAALERAATVCLQDLGASRGSRSLLLTAQDAWVASWPLSEDEDEDEAGLGRGRLAVTTVFGGQLQSGMVMVYGTRIRVALQAAIEEARGARIEGLRARIVDRLMTAPDVGEMMRSIADAACIELRRLERLEDLSSDELRRLAAATLCQPRLVHASLS